MTILHIETSTDVCSAALTIEGVPQLSFCRQEGSGHAALLPTYIQQIISYIHSHHYVLDAVALSEGPGSYTGLRIGTSTAKGICYGLQIPLVPIPTTEVLCVSLIAQSDIGNAYLCPMIDARRMEVYTALYNRQMQEVLPIQSRIITDATWLPDNTAILYFGNGADKCQEILESDNVHYVPHIVPEAQYMGTLAEIKLGQGKGLMGNELAYYSPYYLKEFIAAPSHVKGLQ